MHSVWLPGWRHSWSTMWAAADMSWLDYLLLALIGGYCAYLLLRRKKKDGCCGDCSRCGGCGRKSEK